MRFIYALFLMLCAALPMIAHAQTTPATNVPVCSGDWHSIVNWDTDAPSAIGASSNYTRYGITTTIAASNSPNKTRHSFSKNGSYAAYGGSPILYAQGVDFDINFSVPVSQIRFAGIDLDGNESLVVFGELNGSRISPSAISGPSSNPMDLSQLASGEVIAQRSGTSITNQGWADNEAIIGFSQPVDRVYISVDNRKNTAVTTSGTTVLGDVQTCADFTDASSTQGDTFHNSYATSALYMGASVSGDENPGNSASASADDDNGVNMPSTLTAGAMAGISVNVSQAAAGQGYLQGWIDWNGDGDFTDSGEQIATNRQYTSGTNGNIIISVTPPYAAASGQIFGRFRWSSTASLSSTDIAHDGEVEDVSLSVVAPAIQSCSAANPSDPYADYAIFYSDNPMVNANYDDPDSALGAPDVSGQGPAGAEYFVSIGTPGDMLIMGFSNNFLSNSGSTGKDLRIYEIGSPEPLLVALYPTAATKALLDANGSVLPDADGYYPIGTSAGGTGTIDIDAAFGNAFISGQLQFTAVKMTTPPSGATSGGSPGPDINAVQALTTHSCSTPPSSASDPDRSDAPANYGQAQHAIVTNMRLGKENDHDTASIASTNADGDDNSGINDDDGVNTPALGRGLSGDFVVTVKQPAAGDGYLQGWVDWNNDGDFTDSGEKIANNLKYNSGTGGKITIPITVPLNANIGPTFTRFRWSTTSGLGATGSASDGEVEDYQVIIHDMTVASSDVPICSGEWQSLVDWATDAPTAIGSTKNISRYGINASVTAQNSPSEVSRYYNPNAQPNYGADFGGAPSINIRGAGVDVTFSRPVNNLRFYITDLDANESAIVYGERDGVRVSPSVTEGPLTTTPLYRFKQSDGLVVTERVIGNNGQDNELNAAIFGFSQPVDFIYIRVDLRRYSDYSNNGVAAIFDIQSCADFTDAPSSFGDTFHGTSDSSALYLGLGAEGDAAPGNDPDAASDDDDGVTMPTLALGTGANITVSISQAAADIGYLQGWIDWNGDGDFDDSGEHVANDLQYSAGTNGDISVPITVPIDATQAPTFGRFRWSSESGLDSSSPAADGEVEDVSFTIVGSPSMQVTKTSAVWDPTGQHPFAVPGSDVIFTMVTTNDGDAPIDSNSVFLIDALAGDVEYYNGDIDDSGPATDPVTFSQANGAGLSFDYTTDVAYSDASTPPSSFADCAYTPNAGYDAAVTYICINPSGTMAAGDPDPEFTVQFRARVH